MLPNPYASYWAQFSFRTTDSGAIDRSKEARALWQSQEPHDERTRRLIEQYQAVYKLEEAGVVVPLIDKWSWLEQMGDSQQKQAMIEPLIQRWQRAPTEHKGELIFLLLVLEPIRRSVAKSFLAGVPMTSQRSGSSDWHRRNEDRILRDMEREDLFDHTRIATLEILDGYKFNVERFFAWFRETLSWKIIRIYKRDYLDLNGVLPAVQAEAVQNMLHGFEIMGEPDLRTSPGYLAWRTDIWDIRSLFLLVDSYREAPQVRKICKDALGRLGQKQRETLEAYFYEGHSLLEIAERRKVSPSTVGNTKAQAESRLRDDDIFYCALDAIGRVRHEARRRQIEERYPDGVLPDGTRYVFID